MILPLPAISALITMSRLRLAPEVPDLAALGAERVEDLLTPGALLEEGRAEVVEEDAGATLLRCPLPGTPGEQGGLRGAPRGAGTGWMRLRRYVQPRLGELVRTRLGRPSSLSPAEREWNLFCALRAAGVSTPELLAVAGGDGALWSRHSVIVTREPDPWTPLREWLGEGSLREATLDALGYTLARMARAGLVLPSLKLEHFGVARAGDDDCAAETISLLQAGAKQQLRSIPDLLVVEVRGGRQTRGAVPLPQVLAPLEAELSTRSDDLRRIHQAAQSVEEAPSPT